MPKSVYVASHCRWAALHIASVLERAGLSITSRWINQPFNPTASFSEADRISIAMMDRDDVLRSDALVLLAGPDRYSGGKFVEAGIAIGVGKRVVIIGRRENMLLWLPFVEAVESPEAAAELLSAPAPLSGRA